MASLTPTLRPLSPAFLQAAAAAAAYYPGIPLIPGNPFQSPSTMQDYLDQQQSLNPANIKQESGISVQVGALACCQNTSNTLGVPFI